MINSKFSIWLFDKLSQIISLSSIFDNNNKFSLEISLVLKLNPIEEYISSNIWEILLLYLDILYKNSNFSCGVIDFKKLQLI